MTARIGGSYAATVLGHLGYGERGANRISYRKRISRTRIQDTALWNLFTRGDPNFTGRIDVWYAWSRSHKVVKRYSYVITRHTTGGHTKVYRRAG